MIASPLAKIPVGAGVGEEAEAVSLPRLNRKRHIVENGEVGKQLIDLEGARQSAPDALRCAEPIHQLPIQSDLARIVGQLTEELGQQGCLAGAVWADQCVDLAFKDIKIYPVSRRKSAETLAQSADTQKRSSHCSPLPRASCRIRPLSPPRE